MEVIRSGGSPRMWNMEGCVTMKGMAAWFLQFTRSRYQGRWIGGPRGVTLKGQCASGWWRYFCSWSLRFVFLWWHPFFLEPSGKCTARQRFFKKGMPQKLRARWSLAWILAHALGDNIFARLDYNNGIPLRVMFDNMGIKHVPLYDRSPFRDEGA